MSDSGVRNQARVVRPQSVDLNPGDWLLNSTAGAKFGTILADPPWRFSNRTGKMAPEHRRLSRYATMSHEQIMELPIPQVVLPEAHLYLWVPNALITEGLEVMKRWGFTYKTNIVWFKIRKDGGPDGRGVGFYFRNVTELVLFGIRGRVRTLKPGRTQVNLVATRKRRHSQKPDELYGVIERCSPGPFIELFARQYRGGWHQWGDEIEKPPLRLVSPLCAPPKGRSLPIRRRV
jgi:N6-adenosine-specific RNA methylase IME4